MCAENAIISWSCLNNKNVTFCNISRKTTGEFKSTIQTIYNLPQKTMRFTSQSIYFTTSLHLNITTVFFSINPKELQHPRKIVGNSGVSSQTGKEGQKHSKAQNIFCYGLKMNEIASVLS